MSVLFATSLLQIRLWLPLCTFTNYIYLFNYHLSFSGLTRWLGDKKSIWPVEVTVWLSVWSKVHMICIWPSWCNCHPIISCFIKIQNGSAFLVPAYPGCPGKEAIKWVYKWVYLTSFKYNWSIIKHTTVRIWKQLQYKHQWCADAAVHIYTHTTILRLSGFCLEQPGWASTERNIHPLTPTVVISRPLSASSIYYDPWHPPCSIYVSDSLFPKSHTIATYFAVIPRLCKGLRERLGFDDIILVLKQNRLRW